MSIAETCRNMIPFFTQLNKFTIAQNNNLIGWNSVHISDIFNCYRANIKWNVKCKKGTGADAGDFQCCQCNTLKWFTLISKVEFSFVRMLWTRFSNLTGRSCGRHCSETLTSVGAQIWLEDTIFLVILFWTQSAILCNVLSVLASFPTTKLRIYWAALCGLFWGHGF